MLLGLGLIVACFGTPVHAQDSAPVNFPKGDASWLVEIRYHAGEKPAEANPEAQKEEADEKPPQIQTIQIDRVGNLRRDRMTWTNGKKTETWWNREPEFVMFQDARIDNQIIPTRPGELFSDLRLDAGTFTWVNAGNFVEESSRGGQKVKLYRASIPNHGLWQAWIHSETGFPLALDNGFAIYGFTLLPPPTEALIMPQEYADLVERYIALRTPSPVSPNKRRR